jgi:hypothetical protein
VTPGQFSKEEVLIQVAILSLLAADFVIGGNETPAAADNDFEDEDEMDYDEEGGDDMKLDEYGGEFGISPEGGDQDDSDQQDEAALLACIDLPQGREEYKVYLAKVVKTIGQATVSKII